MGFLEEVKKIVENENVSESDLDKVVYAFDSSYLEGKTNFIIWPRNVDEIKKIIKIANRERVKITLRGGGTGLVGGAVPENSVVLDLSKMNKILEINTDENYVIVEAGVILDDLNNELENKGLLFPIRPGSHAVCTIGGIIATNAAGINAIKYGKVENWLIELEVVTGNGDLKIVKGDEIKVFCGSEGLYGVITKAKLRLTKSIKKTTISKLALNNYEELMKAIKEFKDKAVALEFIDEMTSSFLGMQPAMYLIAEFEDDSGDIKEKEEIEKIMRIRDGIYAALVSNNYSIITDPQVHVDKLPILLKEIKKMGKPHFGHVGIGLIHVHFKPEEVGETDRLYELVLKLGGKISGEHGIGKLKQKFLSENEKERIMSFKKRYDPNNVFGELEWV
ncbi:MAG: FAD-binding oxidoreductase [Candidatus Parvarchaeota archaeon]|nr:FAD-binding oxidoreductase [Candidatus Jingweiarchaeum tengchongense]MCW1298654.1 FAD-binding oxidoreductase [Candidatus Jingweiarchaeum tengchongense]MCW1300496.1 FAD-binding oxidoreductase [Candidatus Jingweiarchaeum tengchongense]MCW1304689.1 FAD-binding oxidoreductase [Candidatus Jingweiarchaeum tengchongense]MCW1305878.1 FAD-binding oxidoreductase [Candidatus Jingweiarchaeum tengchongense]